MKIETIDPIADARWLDLAGKLGGGLFHSPTWMNVLAETYGFEPRAKLLIRDDGLAEAGFAYVEIEDFMDPRTISLPFSDFCDPLVTGYGQWQALMTDLDLDNRRLHLRCLHTDIPSADPRLSETTRARWHAIDLERDLDAIWDSIDPAARRSIRKASTAGVIVRPADNVDDLRSFFALHKAVRRHKYRLLAQPYRFFEAIWRNFIEKDAGTLLVATLEDRVIAGIVFLEWDGVLYYKFNASHSDSLGVRPNDSLAWGGIEHAKARGLRLLDFGLTDSDQEGLIRYKSKYATTEKPIRFLRHIPGGAPSRGEATARDLLHDVTELLIDPSVPDEISEAGGDTLYRYFL